MTKQIVIINGHPDNSAAHYCDALIQAYSNGAAQAEHQINIIRIADLNFPLVRSQAEWEKSEPCTDILRAQELIRQADHLMLVYPLWMGTMPALFKGFLEQLLRPAFTEQLKSGSKKHAFPAHKTARVVVTMGMPASIYRWFFGAHGLKSLQRNILPVLGIRTCRRTLIGNVEGSAKNRNNYINQMLKYGSQGL